ncbi:hypothetical protein QTP88_017941 [Uroleucon formosanum]
MSTNKKRKIEEENRGFRSEWTDTYAFVPNNMGQPKCLICDENFKNNKKSNIERHFLSKHDSFGKTYPAGNERKTAVAELIRKSHQSTSKFNNWLQSASNLTAASFVVSHEIMKSGKPFTDGEYIKKCFIGMSEHLFSEFKNKTEIINKIKDIPLAATTVRDRAVRMAENVTEQQFSDLKSSPVFSLACDESCDVKNIAQLTLMGRYVSSTGVHEELLGLLPLKGQTRGEDICAAITKFCKEKEINLDKLISLCTDGSSNMVGKYKGFVTLFGQNVKHELLSFHCIVHQEALCAQTFPVEINQVMTLVVKIINKIIASALNHRQFRALLDEVNARYKDLLMFNNVRWLSRGAVLKRFTDCFEPIKDFLTNKGINYPELCDDMWLQKLYFAIYLTSSLNHLNKKLQGKGNTAHTLLETVLSFEQQLQLFSDDIESGNLDHFESLKEYTESSGCIIDLEYFKLAIQSMKNSFSRRFEDFRKYKSMLKFLTSPLIAETGQINFPSFPSVDKRLFSLQLIELKTKDLWSTKFENLKTDIENLEREKGFLAANHKWTELAKCQKEEQVIFDVWNSLPESFSQLKMVAFGILTIFGSTYICEQTFSNMNFIKNKLRNQLNDISLDACLKLKTTDYFPELNKLSGEIQMSNINTKSSITKLRNNETSKVRTYRPNPDSGLQVDSVASGSLQISKPTIISESSRPKYGGRGIAIQQLAESMSSKDSMKNSDMNFSNSSIERHFNRLKEENLKKLNEENENIWGKFIHSNKST